MKPVIVLTELRQLPATERWGRLVAPLHLELAESGLGEVLDLQTLQQQAVETGACWAEELAVELDPAGFNYGYARDLIDRVLSSTGVRPERDVLPQRWKGFGCEEYFRDGWAGRGHFDEFSQTPVIVPLAGAYEDPELRFLVVGHSGCDGIDFGYRRNEMGLWAFYPLRREFKSMALTVKELVSGWCSGALSV